LGFERGNHLAILSENCRQWLYACMGTVSLGGVALGVYPTSPYPEVHYVVKHSDSVMVVCEDQEQTDKILEVIDDLPKIKKIIVKDMKGLRHYPQDRLISFAEVEKLGRELAERQPGLFENEIRQGSADDVCIMIYTSGTTGPPKGAMVNHNNIEAMTHAGAAAMAIDEKDSVVSYLPLCHVAEQIFSLYLPVYYGVQVSFAESIATIQNDLREIGPTVFLGVPRIWEKLQNAIVVNIQDSSWVKRKLFERCIAIGRRVGDQRLAGQPVGFFRKRPGGSATA
jgi:long-chain acyl-CoA synthetase